MARSTSSVPEQEPHQLEVELSSTQALSLLELTCMFYWEQDAEGRFTHIVHGDPDLAAKARFLLGKARSEMGCEPISCSWQDHDAAVERREPYRDFVIRWLNADGTVQYMSSSGQPVFGTDGRFTGYRGVTIDVTEQYRDAAFVELERKLANILTIADDACEVVSRAIQFICQSQGWSAGRYWLTDHSRHVLRCAVDWPGSSDADADDRSPELVPGEGLAGTVWQTGKPLWIPSLADDDHECVELTTGDDCRSALLFPVITKGSVAGVFCFTAAHIDKPDPRLQTIVQIIGVQIAAYYEAHTALEQLGASKDLYASTFDLAAIGISHVDQKGRFIHVNQQLCDMLGYTREELLALTVKDVSHPDDAHVTDTGRWRLHSGEVPSLKVEKRYVRKDGSVVWVRITAATKKAQDGSIEYDISIVEDVSDRKAAESRIQYLATHDDLTSLPNREMFSSLLNQAISTARRTSRYCAVLFADLDRFKIINDSLGHDAGDALLKEMAARLKSCLREGDVVARFGGDEFVILLEALDCADSAVTAGKKILSSLLQPVRIKGHECRVTASIGIASFPEHAKDADSLIKHADIAMYAAKERGKNNAQLYSSDMSPVAIERLTLESKLRGALEREEFTIQYQPKIDTATNRVVSVEALLRWWNHEIGTVSPAQFIPLAEETGLIVPIGMWVLRRACEQNVAWQRRGLPSVITAVNLSPRQFNDADLVHDISAILEQTGMRAELLELEITESAITSDVDRAIEIASAIKHLGIRLAIDDFGTGYSSLTQLKRFPIDTLKIDRSFVRDIPENVQDRAITEAIISMGTTLGVKVVAEGVETTGQYRFVKERGCHEVQGYLFGRPSHPDGLVHALESGYAPKE